MKDFLTFRRMITPLIIQALFWAVAGIIAITGLVMIFTGATSHYGGGAKVLLGLIALILGPFVVRIWCELLILLFRINERLTDIRNSLKPPQT